MQGAVVSPSDEDSQTFTVNAANGEIYRLRGASDYPDFPKKNPIFFSYPGKCYIHTVSSLHWSARI